MLNAAILVLLWCSNAYAQTTYDVTLGNLLLMQQGIGWPAEIHVVEGHGALIRLATDLVDLRICEVTTPSNIKFNVLQPPSNRYESWSDGCGLRVRNVTIADEGRWRLTATTGNYTLAGWTELYILDKVPEYSGSQILLQDGQTAHVNLTTLDNSYCLVTRPFSESSLVPGHCRVTLDRITRAVQGEWDIVLGIPGQISELKVERRVAVEAERLDTGYIHDANTNKVHIYCNILHTTKNITFCRFQKINEPTGYNIMDGLSDGVHSYYGDGFAKRHCGMTIENPTSQVLGSWRCTVGVQQWIGNQIQPQTPLQALIRVASYNVDSRIRNSLEKEGNEMRTIFVQREMSYTIMCRAEVSLAYCWFQHPNGAQYTPVDKTDDDQMFWYAGESLHTGDCGITFPHATEHDAGEWICHMGPRNQLGVEITDKVAVRVTGPLAANKKEVTVERGENTTLYCHTSNGNRPLSYCRFLSPSFVGISLDSSVTENEAILDRFYFTPGRELQYGDCSMEINSATEKDAGVWTCAALLDDETLESRDTISLHVESNYIPQSRAGIAGMAIGLVSLLLILVGVVWYKRDKLWCQNNPPDTIRTDNISLQTLPELTISRRSGSSTNSEGSTEHQNPY